MKVLKRSVIYYTLHCMRQSPIPKAQCRPWRRHMVRLMTTAGPGRMQLTVMPSECLVDDKVHMHVSGLDPGQPVTLHASVTENKMTFASSACFVADQNGGVDVQKQASLKGTYTGIDQMGLFWSMLPSPGQRKGLRLTKKDITKPFEYNLSVFNGHHTFEELYNNEQFPLASTVCHRSYMSKGIKKIPVREGKIRGALYLPEGEGPFPGVIDMFGTVGGLIEFRSALLASRGIASFSLPYFMYEDLPEYIGDVELEYFLEAVDWLCAHKSILPGGVGMVGVSKGTEMAYLSALHSPKVKAVVSISGCTFLSTIGMYYQGKPMENVVFIDDEALTSIDGAVGYKNTLNYTKKDIFPLWKSDAKFLNVSGELDECAPWQCLYMLQDMYPLDKKSKFEVVVYPGAGHLIEPPYTPLCSMSYHKAYDYYFLWGGVPDKHAIAQEDSWRRILHFFKTELRATTNSKL